MVIFGWGHQTIKEIGITFKNLCAHCHNEDYWMLTRTITWFTLFFIPIIPYSIKYFLSCSICKYGLTLDSEQIEQIKPLAEANQLLIDGAITQEEHRMRLSQLHSGSPDPVQAEIEETKVLTGADENLSYCAGCGTATTKELKFCGNCGTAVVPK